jgi:hypothetical protein
VTQDDSTRASAARGFDPLGTATNSFTTEEGVYGVILVAGLIVVTGSDRVSAWNVFVAVVITVLVFWAAHVYAGTVAHHGVEDGRVVGLRESFRGAIHRSWGLLVSALIPAVILLLGATEAVSDPGAIWIALWVCVAVLAILGFIAFTRRRAAWWVRILGALATAGFGMIMVALKVALH